MSVSPAGSAGGSTPPPEPPQRGVIYESALRFINYIGGVFKALMHFPSFSQIMGSPLKKVPKEWEAAFADFAEYINNHVSEVDVRTIVSEAEQESNSEVNNIGVGIGEEDRDAAIQERKDHVEKLKEGRAEGLHKLEAAAERDFGKKRMRGYKTVIQKYGDHGHRLTVSPSECGPKIFRTMGKKISELCSGETEENKVLWSSLLYESSHQGVLQTLQKLHPHDLVYFLKIRGIDAIPVMSKDTSVTITAHYHEGKIAKLNVQIKGAYDIGSEETKSAKDRSPKEIYAKNAIKFAYGYDIALSAERDPVAPVEVRNLYYSITTPGLPSLQNQS